MASNQCEHLTLETMYSQKKLNKNPSSQVIGLHGFSGQMLGLNLCFVYLGPVVGVTCAESELESAVSAMSQQQRLGNHKWWQLLITVGIFFASFTKEMLSLLFRYITFTFMSAPVIIHRHIPKSLSLVTPSNKPRRFTQPRSTEVSHRIDDVHWL